MQIWHVWPSVRKAETMDFDLGNVHYSIVIPEGNWDAESLANYINSEMGLPTFMTYDSGRLGYIFDPALEYVGGSTCLYLLGIPETEEIGGHQGPYSASLQPVNFGGPSTINLLTNHSLYNAPLSSLLCSIPVTQNYGELISYTDQGNKPVLVCAHHLTHMDIVLVDELGRELVDYDEIPWLLEIEIQTVLKARSTESAQEAKDRGPGADLRYLSNTASGSAASPVSELPVVPGSDGDVELDGSASLYPNLVDNHQPHQNP